MQLLIAAALFGISAASPLLPILPRAPQRTGLQSASGCQSQYAAAGDAPYKTPCSTLAAAVTCPKGVGKSAGGTVFLVHGTGSTGSESWENGPYNVYLPTEGPGYDICWVDLPARSTGDMQISSEYVAYNVARLAQTSTTGKVSVIGHSQGAGCNPQWAFQWWPSTRKYVAAYVALAGDFKGTAEGPLLCDTQKLTISGGCTGSVWQQSIGSRYLQAQNTAPGNAAIVPTTSLYTLTDDVIQPELLSSTATSNLPGATVYAMQDLSVCGPLHVADHFLMIVDPAAYALAVDALAHGGHADASRFSKTYCTYFRDNVLVDHFSSTPALLISTLNDVLALGVAPGFGVYGVKAEPPLQPYVCAAGVAPASACVANDANSNPVQLLANSVSGLITGKPFVPGYAPVGSSSSTTTTTAAVTVARNGLQPRPTTTARTGLQAASTRA